MSGSKLTGTRLESLLGLLANQDGMIRQRARKSLGVMGKSAVPSLILALQNSKQDQVRWGAAKAIGEISDVRLIDPLVKALEDSNHDVAWLAVKALQRFKYAAWEPLLRTLLKRGPESAILRHGAHHVFHNQRERGFNDLLPGLMKSLEPAAVPEAASVAAYDILKRIEGIS